MSSGAEPTEPVTLRRWRRHQRLALDAIAHDHATTPDDERSRAWVVLPPGTGKTWVGLEVARSALVAGEVGRVLVLVPNTAIQGQWLAAARSPEPAGFGLDAADDRGLGSDVTVLTYQSLAVFRASDGELPETADVSGGSPDAAAVSDEADDGHLGRLHPNGRAVVEALAAAGPVLLVLDECHHLLELWGELLAEVLDRVPQARVLGLTATPRETLTAPQAALVDALFGEVAYATAVPAVVREGDLAPFAELAWFTTPTPAEAAWLAESATRFAELVAVLTDPDVGDPPLLTWVQRRWVAPTRATDGRRTTTWSSLAAAEPEGARAALRLHHAGLLDAPEGARLTEEHRQDPTADDWLVLADDWLRTLDPGQRPADAHVLDVVRRALPAVGRVWTRRGIRRGRTEVDRVLARSASKADACVEIVGHEAAALGDRLRMLVLCDHESATATVPLSLRGVVDAEAGSARALLGRLLADPVTGQLDPVLVTGRTVAAGPATAQALLAAVRDADPELGGGLAVEPLADVPGAVALVRAADLPGRAWTSRGWVGHVTRFFESGGCRVLVGTRGLLGEGWDARRTTGLVDLTTATSSTAVVQTRGRSLRTDPAWTDKVAVNWTVTCVAPDHPRGDADWQRLVRKHTGYFGVDAAGDVVDGVAHLDPLLSPHHPPGPDELAALNSRAVVRSQQRDDVRVSWRVGEPYEDVAGTAVRLVVRQPERLGAATGPAPLGLAPLPPGPVAATDDDGGLRVVTGPDGQALLAATEASRAADLARRTGEASLTLVAFGALLVLGLGGAPLPALAALLLALGALAALVLRTRRAAARRRAGAGRRVLAALAEAPSLHQVAAAVADGLQAAGLVSRGADAVEVEVDAEGVYRCRLAHVAEGESRLFADSLDEATAPLDRPRYVVVRRGVVRTTVPDDVALRAAAGRVDRDLVGEVWHAVPSALGARADLAQAYAKAWGRWVSGAPDLPRYTGSPEGAGILAAQHGSDPFAVTSMMRRHWS